MSEQEGERSCKQFRVRSTAEWLVIHQPHGEISKLRNEHQPPAGSYDLYTLVCPCGAKHVTNNREKAP